MSDTRPRPMGPAIVPSLAAVQADLSILTRLPMDVLVDLRRQVRHLDTDLDAAIVGQLADQRGQHSDREELVGVEEAAKLLFTSPDTLYSKWKRLPFAFKDPLDGKIKFRRSGIERYTANRVGGR